MKMSRATRSWLPGRHLGPVGGVRRGRRGGNDQSADAGACERRRPTGAAGLVFPLDWDLDLPDPPLFGRLPLVHTVIAEENGGNDDRYDGFYPQRSSQWDALSHIAHPNYGFYNARREVGTVGDALGIHVWPSAESPAASCSWMPASIARPRCPHRCRPVGPVRRCGLGGYSCGTGRRTGVVATSC